MLCSSAEDEPRYEKLLRGWIEDGTLPNFSNFTQENEKKKRKRKKMYAREESETKKMRMDNGDTSECLSSAKGTPL